MVKGNGIERKGSTKGKNFGDDGPKKGIETGGKGSAGVKSIDMKKFGRGVAKRNNQRGS